ncbi:hypothetical protein HK104_005996, partial [Borealophlyctis nickersoniae]
MAVVGAVALVSPFRLPRRPFIRDIVAFIGAILWILYVSMDQQITFGEGLALIVYYLLYVAMVVFGAWAYRKQKAERLQQTTEEIIDGEVNESGLVKQEAMAVGLPDGRFNEVLKIIPCIPPDPLTGQGPPTPLPRLTINRPNGNVPFFETNPLLPTLPGEAEEDDELTELHAEEDFDVNFFVPHFRRSRMVVDHFVNKPAASFPRSAESFASSLFGSPRNMSFTRASFDASHGSPRAAHMLTPATPAVFRNASTDYFTQLPVKGTSSPQTPIAPTDLLGLPSPLSGGGGGGG